MAPSMTFATLLSAATLALAAGDGAHAAPDAAAGTMQVTKTPSCGGCAAWVDLAREHGLDVEVTDSADYVGMKQAAEVPTDLWACHTSEIDGYVVEDHVPFAAIERLLAERPGIEGISVPGCPPARPGWGPAPMRSTR